MYAVEVLWMSCYHISAACAAHAFQSFPISGLVLPKTKRQGANISIMPWLGLYTSHRWLPHQCQTHTSCLTCLITLFCCTRAYMHVSLPYYRCFISWSRLSWVVLFTQTCVCALYMVCNCHYMSETVVSCCVMMLRDILGEYFVKYRNNILRSQWTVLSMDNVSWEIFWYTCEYGHIS